MLKDNDFTIHLTQRQVEYAIAENLKTVFPDKFRLQICRQLLAVMQREVKLREAVNLALSDMNDDAYYSAAERLERALDDLQP